MALGSFLRVPMSNGAVGASGRVQASIGCTTPLARLACLGMHHLQAPPSPLCASIVAPFASTCVLRGCDDASLVETIRTTWLWARSSSSRRVPPRRPPSQLSASSHLQAHVVPALLLPSCGEAAPLPSCDAARVRLHRFVARVRKVNGTCTSDGGEMQWQLPRRCAMEERMTMVVVVQVVVGMGRCKRGGAQIPCKDMAKET